MKKDNSIFMDPTKIGSNARDSCATSNIQNTPNLNFYLVESRENFYPVESIPELDWVAPWPATMI